MNRTYIRLIMVTIFISKMDFIHAQVFKKWVFKKTNATKWLPAKVPGTVHTDLLYNKVIADPYYGNNEKDLQWIENEDWEYKCQFNLSDKDLLAKHQVLVFEGLDTYAKVYLNHQLILSADNMFRKWEVEVKSYLKVGQNNLQIVFESAVKKGKALAAKLPYTLPGDEKVFTRKAQYQYGWDWGPRFVTCGIWKNIKLLQWEDAKINHTQYIQHEITDSIADIEWLFEVQCESAGDYQFRIDGKSNAYKGKREIPSVQRNILLKKGINTISIPYSIINPKLWWSNGLGAANLYSFFFSLIKAKKTIAIDTQTIGLRTLELIQEKDSIGKSFYFKLNGLPIFMKGANYIPADNFLPRFHNYADLVSNAMVSNMNMLRVWGGGVYADDSFYDACDKAGILVWQDFMFACAMYPGDSLFMDNVKNEVSQQVIRLRNHPSLAIWCGNNEIDEGWKNWGWQKQYNYTPKDSTRIANNYKQLFEIQIPKQIQELDVSRMYWPSSPSIGWGHKESLQEGDSHYWGVWWGMEPFENYTKKVGRFMSEYGFQGMPSMEMFKNFGALNAKTGELDSIILKAHQKHPTGYQTIQTYMARDYKIPKKFEDYVYVSQLLQADGMQMAIEAHRKAKPNCMGTLYWQLNDCWPVSSWSSMDYKNNWKAAQYKIQKAYEDILISVTENEKSYDIYIVSDQLKPINTSLQLLLINFKGDTLWQVTKSISIEANTSHKYYCIDKNTLEKYNSKEVLLISKFSSNGSTNKKQALYYFDKPKALSLSDPKVKIKIIDASTIELSSSAVAKSVFLSDKENQFYYSDNYFDLLPNEKKIISIWPNGTSNIKTSPDHNIQVKTLYDTILE